MRPFVHAHVDEIAARAGDANALVAVLARVHARFGALRAVLGGQADGKIAGSVVLARTSGRAGTITLHFACIRVIRRRICRNVYRIIRIDVRRFASSFPRRCIGFSTIGAVAHFAGVDFPAARIRGIRSRLRVLRWRLPTAACAQNQQHKPLDRQADLELVHPMLRQFPRTSCVPIRLEFPRPKRQPNRNSRHLKRSVHLQFLDWLTKSPHDPSPMPFVPHQFQHFANRRRRTFLARQS